MLKGKKGLYILLPVVVLIWSSIIFQVLDAFDDDDPVITASNTVSFVNIETKEREKFTLGIVDRDPFLGTIYRPKKVVNINPNPRVKKQEIVWPSIKYKGLVSDQNNASSIYLIEINGSDQLMKVNDTFDEVTFSKGSNNTIKLRYKGKMKQFKMSN